MRPVLALTVVLGLMVACSSPTSPSLSTALPLPAALPPGALTRGAMSATVDGIPSEAAGPVASLSSGAVGPTIVATIVGRFERLDTLVSVTVPVAVGAFELGGAAYLDFALFQGPAGRPTSFWTATPFTPGSAGTVTVTIASTTRIAGTFTFTAVSPLTGVTATSRTVSNGAFDLSR